MDRPGSNWLANVNLRLVSIRQLGEVKDSFKSLMVIAANAGDAQAQILEQLGNHAVKANYSLTRDA